MTKWTNDGVTENLNLHTFTEAQHLQEAIRSHLAVLENGPGALLVLYSIILSRGLEK